MHVKRIEDYFDEPNNKFKMRLMEGYLEHVHVDVRANIIRFIFNIGDRSWEIGCKIESLDPPSYHLGDSVGDTKEMLKAVRKSALAEENRVNKIKEKKEKDFKELDKLLEDL